MLLLRKRYNEEQVYLYFNPFPNRGPKIREIKQRLGTLYKQIGVLALVGLVLMVLLIGSANQGVTYFGLLEFACIIGIIVVIVQRVRNKLLPLREELRQELAAEAREKEYTRSVQPPNERQYDDWISAISNYIHNNAPERLHLHEHSDHKAWRKAVNSVLSEEPEEFGASLCLEGRISSSDEKLEHPPLLQKRTSRHIQRPRHYTVYEFTSLFITEDYVAIYTNIVNLRSPVRDREEFEYCYHQHLSHMSLSIDSALDDVDTTLGNVDEQSQRQIKESRLSLTFDSGRTIKRNISTLHVRNEPITGIDTIHEKLIKSLIDHERSMVRSIRETSNLG